MMLPCFVSGDLYEIEEFGHATGQYALHWIDCLEIRVEPKDLKESFLRLL